jgi:hypothetical protein
VGRVDTKAVALAYRDRGQDVREAIEHAHSGLGDVGSEGLPIVIAD